MNWPLASHPYGSYGWLLREVGDALDKGADSDVLDHEDFGRLESIVQRGLKNFFTPPPLPKERFGHRWSFLFPLVQIEMSEEVAVYDLPAGFGGLNGPIVYDPDQGIAFIEEIEVTNERRIAYSRGRATHPGIPIRAAVRVKAYDPAVGTRHEIIFEPEPNREYTVNVPIKFSPPPLTEPDQMPCGGEQHSETMRLACLAAAVPTDEAMQHAYMTRLIASVSEDRLAHAAETLGPNTDRSIGVGVDYRDMMDHIVPVRGVEY